MFDDISKSCPSPLKYPLNMTQVSDDGIQLAPCQWSQAKRNLRAAPEEGIKAWLSFEHFAWHATSTSFQIYHLSLLFQETNFPYFCVLRSPSRTLAMGKKTFYQDAENLRKRLERCSAYQAGFGSVQNFSKDTRLN